MTMASSAFATLLTMLAISTTAAATAASVNTLAWSGHGSEHCCPCAETTGTDGQVGLSVWIHSLPDCCECPTSEPSPSTTLPMMWEQLWSSPPPDHSQDNHNHDHQTPLSSQHHSDDSHGHHPHTPAASPGNEPVVAPLPMMPSPAPSPAHLLRTPSLSPAFEGSSPAVKAPSSPSPAVPQARVPAPSAANSSTLAPALPLLQIILDLLLLGLLFSMH